VLLVVRSSDGHRSIAPTAPLTLWMNGVWQAGLVADSTRPAGDTLVVSAAARTLGGSAISVQAQNQQVCAVTLAAGDPSTEDDAALTFRFGPEYSSANAFAADKRLAATVGVRWDLLSQPVWAPTRAPWFRVAGSLTGTFDYTSAVSTRD
jgi:hypothetical protein